MTATVKEAPSGASDHIIATLRKTRAALNRRHVEASQ